MTILIGCDPELFVYDITGKPLSADGLLPGNKWEPYPVNKGAIQVDGVAAEFNIEPAETADVFLENIVAVEAQMIEKIHETRKDIVLRATPTIKFTRKQWMLIPEQAKMLGCEPDYSAYTRKPNPRPETDKLMRTGSGHLHISWGEMQETAQSHFAWLHKCSSLIWHLDKHLYPESLKWDSDKERQELYGKPGAFRPKSYGVEYRTLSNAWMQSEKTIRYVFEATRSCAEHWLQGQGPRDYKIDGFKLA